MAEKTSHFPVIIIGGGIVGLSASLFLSSHHTPHLLLERHAGPSILPRARGFNTRAMEIFRSVHFDHLVLEAGKELSPSMGICKGNSLKEVIEPRKRKEGKRGEPPLKWLSEGVSPTEGARCTQDMLEPVLVKEARDRGGDVRFGVECQDVRQDEKGVFVSFRDRENDVVTKVTAEYLIAADGAGSPIRKQLGIKTTGKGKLGNLINILFIADLGGLVRGREISICVVDRPEVRGVFTSVNNSDRWVFHLSYDPSKGEKPEDYTMERCRELLRIAIGIPDLDIDIKSARPWTPSDMAVERMQEGRIFLAGDAAHQTTPYAGQGATTGIADVFDLTWKLAMVLKGQANAKLLETYQIERVPVGQFVARESGVLADQWGLPNVGRIAIKFMFKALLRIAMYTGFGYHYDSRTIIPDESANSRWMWWCSVPWTIPSLILDLNGRPRTRAPHAWVQLEGRQISTLDLCGKNFVLLTGSEGKLWCKAAAQVSSDLDLELDAYRVGPISDLSDPKRQWEKTAGVSSQGALLVRPDGFVAWRAQEQDGDLRERLEVVMRRILRL